MICGVRMWCWVETSTFWYVKLPKHRVRHYKWLGPLDVCFSNTAGGTLFTSPESPVCRFNTYRFVNKVYPRVYSTIYAAPCPHDSPLSDPFLYSACLNQSQFGVFSTAPPQGATQIEVNGRKPLYFRRIVEIEYILALGWNGNRTQRWIS